MLPETKRRILRKFPDKDLEGALIGFPHLRIAPRVSMHKIVGFEPHTENWANAKSDEIYSFLSSRDMGPKKYYLYDEEPELTKGVARPLFLSAMGLRSIVKRPVYPNILLKDIERETRKRIRSCMGVAYRESDYKNENLIKIKETITDLAFLAKIYDINMDDFYDFLTPVVIFNESIYRMDGAVEKNPSGQNNLNELLSHRSKMFWAANKFISGIGKRELLNLTPQIIFTIEANCLRETSGPSPEEWVIDYVSTFFKNFLEPSDFEYLDTGFYGDFFTHWFKKHMEEKTKLQLIWNSRCRATDVIDGLIDLMYDVGESIFSPLVLYIYQKCDSSDRNLIKDSVISKQYNPEFESVVQRYSSKLLASIREYANGIKPSRRKIRAFEDRTYKIIDLGMAITKDPSAVKDYENFYNNL